MTRVFIPYSDKTPHRIEVKGHKLVLASLSQSFSEREFQTLGAQEVRSFELPENNRAAMEAFADTIGGELVLTPPGISLGTLLRTLEHQLPWVH